MAWRIFGRRVLVISLARKINFPGWFEAAMCSVKKKECIAAFDPSYISKSGKNITELLLFIELVFIYTIPIKFANSFLSDLCKQVMI